MKSAESEPIPLSALQHAVYCLRQAALIHLERLWAENRFTAEGRVMHVAADKPGARQLRGVRRVHALPIASQQFGIAGVADLVEFHREGAIERAFPVEFKRGKPKKHRADEVQLCAQALCLEEMTGQSVPEGALFYGETRRRVEVSFDEALRKLTIDTIAGLVRLFQANKTPPPTEDVKRCRACSLEELCQPDAVRRAASRWRRHMVSSLEDRDA